MKKLLLVVIGVIGALVLPGTASAHFPVVTGSAVCNDDGTWDVTWTVRPDVVRSEQTWQVTSSSNYSPSGSQSASLPFTRTTTYTGTPRVVTEFVAALWSSGFGGTAVGSLTLPDDCLPTSTTSTTTTTTTTSTTTSTTTTTSTLPDSTTTTTTTVPDATTSTSSSLPDTTSTTEPNSTTTEPEIDEITPLPTTTTPPTDATTTTLATDGGGTTTTVAPDTGATTTTSTQPPSETEGSPPASPTEPTNPTGPTGPDLGPDAPELPVTGGSGATDISSLALLLLTVGAYTMIGLHGHRRPVRQD